MSRRRFPPAAESPRPARPLAPSPSPRRPTRFDLHLRRHRCRRNGHHHPHQLQFCFASSAHRFSFADPRTRFGGKHRRMSRRNAFNLPSPTVATGRYNRPLASLYSATGGVSWDCSVVAAPAPTRIPAPNHSPVSTGTYAIGSDDEFVLCGGAGDTVIIATLTEGAFTYPALTSNSYTP